jgi:1,4-alpha-glucan branching enzyme
MPYQVRKDGKVKFVWQNCLAENVYLVGDFNRWNEESHPMRKTKGLRFELEVKIPPGRYQFKYLIDGVWWNDPDADEYVDNFWGSEDSVILVDAG